MRTDMLRTVVRNYIGTTCFIMWWRQ